MLNRIKNSILCKCLQALLIGYFLMSSLNVSNSVILIVNSNTEGHSVKGITCNFLKKIFKCDGIPEELDDYKAKESKTAKVTKGIPLLEYLVPLNTSITELCFQTESRGKNYIDNPIFSFGFHGKIHLRPPQIMG
ncbi:hypothetical protein [Flavobacterium reichenbachii]|uniref:Uncharacterized protein n=1 Tax=Flavobacterium reichenbachii TaxID=362418 RepID=A0A085ZQ91_9FLAO|nr:hypothetical protein [Flavobacterium reichenbachii]KFF06605.1 hypothetical protein IW19_14300 [Flavobacterium reichenbachii]OXB18792.1 hypothetical protein B0A68_01895 [Flavobacterium reichenbachii]